jgi:hypothetical protein
MKLDDLGFEPERKKFELKAKVKDPLTIDALLPVMNELSSVMKLQSAMLAVMNEPDEKSVFDDIKIPKKWHVQVNRDKKGLIDSFMLTEIIN